MAEIEVPTPNVHTESSLVRGSRENLKKPENDSKKIEAKPLKGGITKKNPSFKEKLRRSFVKEDIKDIRDYVIFDVVIPSIRKSIFDTIVGTAAQIFGVSVPRSFGYSSDGRYNGGRLTPHERQYRDYTSIQRSRQLASEEPRLARYDRFYVTDYPFVYKEDADSVLEQLMDICDYQGWVSVSQFFNIADPDGTIAGKNPYTNSNYGWHSIDNASVKFIQDYGYVINLPPARPR